MTKATLWFNQTGGTLTLGKGIHDRSMLRIKDMIWTSIVLVDLGPGRVFLADDLSNVTSETTSAHVLMRALIDDLAGRLSNCTLCSPASSALRSVIYGCVCALRHRPVTSR